MNAFAKSRVQTHAGRFNHINKPNQMKFSIHVFIFNNNNVHKISYVNVFFTLFNNARTSQFYFFLVQDIMIRYTGAVKNKFTCYDYLHLY